METPIIDQGYLQVSSLHQIYYYFLGNKSGPTVLYVHGGPGGGCSLDSAAYFNLHHYNVVLFDQRGCGKSLPFASVEENTTFDLVGDIEKLRVHLGIERWILFGGSWGSTLSLIYAINYPQRVQAMVLRGIFLARNQDLDFLYQNGTRTFFPEKYQTFTEILTTEERQNVVASYYKYLNHSDKEIAIKYALRWAQYELDLLTLTPNTYLAINDPEASLAISRLEAHYFYHHCFMEEDYILKRIETIRNIPTHIVHGRYDMVCAFENAWTLHQHLNESILYPVTLSGHSAKEKSTFQTLVAIMQKLEITF